MSVAIIIPTANKAREPARTSIVQATWTSPPGTRIVVVESSGPGFRFSRSVNRGMNETPDADAWILLNDDCVMDGGWVQAMLAEARPGVGIVGAVLRYPDGRLQHAGGRIMSAVGYLAYCIRKKAPLWGLRAAWATLRHGRPYFGHYTRLRHTNRLDFVTGACMLITRECRQRIGGFDEDYEFSFEDVDYCLRAREAGLRIALATNAKGRHQERATGGGLKNQALRSDATFAFKWSPDRVGLALRVV